MFVVYFPGFYVDCLKELAALWKDSEGGVVNVDEQVEVMKGWGTVIAQEESKGGDDDEMEDDDDESEEEEDERGSGLQCMA